MCGRYANFLRAQDLADVFAIAETSDEARLLPPSWNVAPTQFAPIVNVTLDGTQRRLVAARWGLIPGWAKDPSIGARMFNARRESVADKPAFRAAFQKRRCLVPANGYYEWKTVEEKTGQTVKQPFYIYPADGSPVALAGLWETRKDEGDEREFSFTILTTAARARLARIHDRQPVMLTRDRWDAWLDPETPHEELHAIAASSSPMLAAHAVGRDVGNVRTNHPGLIAPIE